MRIYAQKDAPGLHKGKNRRFISFCLQPKMGVIHQGVIHQALQYAIRDEFQVKVWGHRASEGWSRVGVEGYPGVQGRGRIVRIPGGAR